MVISRRDFLLTGSAISTLWLAGCGGGGSASGAPKAGGTTGPTAGACTFQTTSGSGAIDPANLGINFTTTSAFPHAATPLVPVDAPNAPTYMACSNPILENEEGIKQEFFVNLIDTPEPNVVRSLRLHLAIPKSYQTGSDAPQIKVGYVFRVGDPSSASNCSEVFSGVLVVNNLATGKNWAYQVTAGTVEVLDDGYGLVFTTPIKLTGVVATATTERNNQASGTVQMDGAIDVNAELLTGVIAQQA